MTVPYTFGTATTSIPLSNLDSNFNTPITLGNTSIYLGNTTTTIGNLTLTNATISSGTVNITNVTVTTANVTNITVTGTANIATGNVTTLTSTSITDSGLTSGRVTYAGTAGLLQDSASLTYNGTTLTATTGANFCTTSGNVGIGTASPADKLGVYGDSVDKIASYVENNNAAGASGSDKRLSLIMGGSSAFSITGWQNAGVIEATSTGGLWLGAYNGVLKFATGSSARTERMRIDTSGNLLVGGTSSAAKFNVYGGNATTGINSYFANNVSGGNVKLHFTDLATYNWTCGTTGNAFTVSTGEYGTTAGTEYMRIDSSGNLLVGTTSTLAYASGLNAKLNVLGTGGTAQNCFRDNEPSPYWGGGLFLQKVLGTGAVTSGTALGAVYFGGYDGTQYTNSGQIITACSGAVSSGVVPVTMTVFCTSGGVQLTNTATSWASASDERLKNVTGVYSNALTLIDEIKPVKFTWKDDDTEKPCVGILAQSVISVVPEAVDTFVKQHKVDDENPDMTEYLNVRYTELIPLMIASIQELKAEFEAYKATHP